MSRSESIAALVAVLRDEAAALRRLRDALASHRDAFVALRSRDVDGVTTDLEPLATAVTALAERRQALVGQLCASLAVPASRRALGVLLAALPASERAALEPTLREARTAATAARHEARLGGRLLEVARRCRMGVLHTLCGTGQADGGAAVYDRSARARPAALDGGRIVRGMV